MFAPAMETTCKFFRFFLFLGKPQFAWITNFMLVEILNVHLYSGKILRFFKIWLKTIFAVKRTELIQFNELRLMINTKTITRQGRHNSLHQLLWATN